MLKDAEPVPRPRNRHLRRHRCLKDLLRGRLHQPRRRPRQLRHHRHRRQRQLLQARLRAQGNLRPNQKPKRAVPETQSYGSIWTQAFITLLDIKPMAPRNPARTCVRGIPQPQGSARPKVKSILKRQSVIAMRPEKENSARSNCWQNRYRRSLSKRAL